MASNGASFFTHYWTNRTWDQERHNPTPEAPLVSNLFLKSGVRPGDYIYAVTIRNGELYVAEPLRVKEVLDAKAASRRFKSGHPWDASDHVLTEPGGPNAFDGPVPLSIVRKLRFGHGLKPLAFKKGTHQLDGQTLRGVRRMSPESAHLLNSYLKLPGIGKRTHAHASRLLEGAAFETRIDRQERNKVARNACIAIHGYACFGCKRTMESIYGAIGRNLIHVHHIKPLSSHRRTRRVDPAKDLVPVCPNCHAIIHRNATPLPIEELQELLRRQEQSV